ncbi:MAG: LamG-like jellyroll fold domain-containing protein [Verrucomicrobiales bacterium]
MPPITRSAPALAAALWLTAAALPCPALEHDWQFAPQHWEGKALKAAKGDLKLVAAQEPDLYKTELKLGGEQLMWAEGVDPASLPQEKITVEAWLSLEKTQKWGGIAGFLQDNGSYERGWLLGYSDNGFTFWLSTGGPLMMLESPRGIVPGEPVHVAGVYDGASIKLYVGGKLEAQRAASGPIAYPDAAFYTLGAYKDANESYPMAGGTLRRVRVLDSALSEAEIRRHAGLREPLGFEIEPSVLFTGPGKARVEWLAGPPGSGTVGFGTSRALGSTARAFGGKMAGSGALSYAELENLEPDTKYYFRVAGLGGRLSEVMEFHTGFAFRAPTAGQPGDAAARGIGEYLSREPKALLPGWWFC